jgi:methyltransferase
MSPDPATSAFAIAATLVVLLIMLGELFLSRSNEKQLRTMGAIEPAGDVYRLMAWAYPLTFVAAGIEGALWGPEPGATTAAGAVLFLAGKALKFWAIASLGKRWTFRVLILPNAPLVTRGPYTWLRHPNYVGVIGELAGFALLVGAPIAGMLGVGGFAVLLWRRIAIEEQALGIRG